MVTTVVEQATLQFTVVKLWNVLPCPALKKYSPLNIRSTALSIQYFQLPTVELLLNQRPVRNHSFYNFQLTTAHTAHFSPLQSKRRVLVCSLKNLRSHIFTTKHHTQSSHRTRHHYVTSHLLPLSTDMLKGICFVSGSQGTAFSFLTLFFCHGYSSPTFHSHSKIVIQTTDLNKTAYTSRIEAAIYGTSAPTAKLE